MTNTFLIDLIITLFAYFVLAVSFLGWGWISSKVLRINVSCLEEPFASIWLGWAVLLLVLQILNLFIPIGYIVSISLLFLGIVFAIILSRVMLKDKFLPVRGWLFSILLITATLFIGVFSMTSPSFYDGGLYYFNAIRWLNQSPIVLGLGDLHGRLAFNQSLFIYTAFLNIYPFYNHGYNLANGFLWLLLSAECLRSFSLYVFRREHSNILLSADIVPILFIPALIYFALRSNISSPGPDTASSFLQILLFIYLVRQIQEKISNEDNDSRLAFILVMSATAITVKLTSLFYVLTICILLLLIRLFSQRLSLKNKLLALLRHSWAPALILVVWTFRGILLSGCPFYPSTLGCLPVQWAEPISLVRLEATRIYGWARQSGKSPDQVLASWNWLKPWFKGIMHDNFVDIVYPLAFSILGILASIVLFAVKPISKINFLALLIPLPVVIGLIGWFGLAPNPRFANALFLIFPVSAAVLLFLLMDVSAKLRQWIVLIALIAVNASIIGYVV